MEAGEKQTVETMIKCISVASANDACVAMAEHIAALYECKDPEKMAEELIALSSGEGKINDDMSVAVALVQKEKKGRKTEV